MKKTLVILVLCLFAVTASAQTELAKELYSRASKEGADINGIINTELATADSMSCSDLAVFFCKDEDYVHAAQCWEIAAPKFEKFGKNYEKVLRLLLMCYTETNDVKGQTHLMALMEEHNEHELTLPCDEPECMTERAEYLGAKGDHAKAKDYYLKALAMPMTDAQKAKVYESYAKFNFMQHEQTLAAEYYLMAANAKKADEGETEGYIQLVYTTATLYFTGKQYEKALGYYRQVIAFYEKYDSDAARKNVALGHQGLGKAYFGLHDNASARDEYKLVAEYYEKYDKDSEEYPKAIERVASAEKFNKEYDASIEHYNQVIAIYKERCMYEEAYNTWNSLSMCYFYARRPAPEIDEELEAAAMRLQREKIDTAIKEIKENMEISGNYLGEFSNANSLGSLAYYYCMKEEYAQGIDYYNQYMEAIRKALRDEFRMKSEAERMTTWKEVKSGMESLMLLLTTLPDDYESLMPELSSLAYDCMLLSKGILLNSSIEFEKVVNASNDAKLKATYEETKRINAELQKLRYTASTEEDLQQIVELQQKSQQLQLELNRGCAEIADFTNYMGYSWKDVQAKLQKDDVAMEFATITTGFLDSENYMIAIVLTRDMKQPVVVPVCTIEQVKAMQNPLLYSTADGGIIVWSNLAMYFKDKKRIYFSADGAFNQMGIEYLQWEGKPMSEQKDMVRLSSTKELCYKSGRSKIEHAAIFGDINYTEEGNYTADTKRSVATMRGSAQDAAEGDIQFGNLDGTRKEMEEINKTLKSSGIRNIQTFADTEASEEAFLSLSDSKVNLLHIATHGAYLANSKVTESEAMQQSILAFAGANLGNEGTKTDGYVTAADVAKMNLRNCQLAVLSACETALGKMGDDGVFGLQRGFKNAGVHTLLMSLRQVDDKATTELMTQFYKSLMTGNTPNESLRKAQQYLRKNGYDDPQYWASFIILDGNR